MGMGVRTVTSSENLAACGPSNVVLREDIAADDYAFIYKNHHFTKTGSGQT